MTYEHEIRQGGFDIATVKPLAGSKKAFLAAIAGSEKMSPTSFFPKVLKNRWSNCSISIVLLGFHI